MEAADAYDITVVELRGRRRAMVNFPHKFGLPVEQTAIKIGGAHSPNKVAKV